MTTRALITLLAAATCLVAADRAHAQHIIIVPPGETVKVKTPLSKGPVWVRYSGGWRRLHEVQKSSQRILRKIYGGSHQIMKGERKEWLSIDKSGTATVKLSAAPEATGQPYTIRIACDVEEMVRGAEGGSKYMNARIELQVVVDLPKYLSDYFLSPGDQVSLSIPSTIRVRRVTVLKDSVAAAAQQGALIPIVAKEAGKTKVTVNYWIGDEVSERFSREVKVEVSDPPLEYVCDVEPGETKRVTFEEIAKALKLPSDEGAMKEIQRWVGPASASVRFDAAGLEVSSSVRGRSTAVIPFLGAKRNHPFEAWVRFTVACGEDGDAPAPTSAAPSTPDPAPNPGPTTDPATPPEVPAEPAEALEVLNQFGAPMGNDYLARTKVRNNTSSPVEVSVTIRFKGKRGDVFGEELALGPKTLAPGQKGSYKSTLKGAGAVVDSFEVLTRVGK